MSYSFETKQDRWSELNDEYQSILDELTQDQEAENALVSALIVVEDFDIDEVL